MLERLASLPQLQELQLDGAVISQRGLKSLTELPNLRALSFQDCSLSDDSLKALYEARLLVGLRVSETDVTEAGILADPDANPALASISGQADPQLPSVQQLPQVKELTCQGPLHVRRDGGGLEGRSLSNRPSN